MHLFTRVKEGTVRGVDEPFGEFGDLGGTSVERREKLSVENFQEGLSLLLSSAELLRAEL